MLRLPCAALVVLLWLATGPSAAASPAAPAACGSPEQAVREAGFVEVGGIEQWVTIEGERCGNPVILFVHGGPGNPLSPYADAIYGAWRKEFTLVQWDQRGAGRTFGRSPPGEDAALSLQQMTADGVELAQHLVARLGQPKLILMGSSWGSILGVHMVQARPELFHAYVGTAQLVDYRENQSASYERVLALARAADDRQTLEALAALGAPPWRNPRHFGVLRRAIRRYEAKVAAPSPPAWWVRAAPYDTPALQAEYTGGEDYSFLQFVGLAGDGMFSELDLAALGTRFRVPLFMVHGAEDLLAMPQVASRYFARIEAPQKEFVLVPDAGHDTNPAVVAAEYRLLMERVRPLTQ